MQTAFSGSSCSPFVDGLESHSSEISNKLSMLDEMNQQNTIIGKEKPKNR